MRLPGTPIHYYNKSVLTNIDSAMGNLMKIEYDTKEARMRKYARVVVELNL